MTQCQVLRCDNLATTPLPYNGGGIRMEAVVCDQHDREISAGAPWAIPEDTILIGNDLKVAGLLPLTQFLGWNEAVGYPDETLQLQFEAADGTPVEFLLTHGVARRVAADLSSFFGNTDQQR